jgi:predicted ATP-dependent protease
MQTLASSLAVAPENLRRRVDPETLSFKTTADVAPLEGPIGQQRAVDAMTFGLEMSAPGYNVFVAGVPGSGRESTIVMHLQRVAPQRATPPDWVYVYNVSDPDRPNAMQLPAGRGAPFQAAMREFVQATQRELPRAFESDEYERRKHSVVTEIGERRDALFQELNAVARANGFVVEMTPAGIISIPVIDGQPVPPQAFAQLPEETRQEIEQRAKLVYEQVALTMRQVRLVEKEAVERLIQLDREVTLFAIGPLLDDLQEDFGGVAEVARYLEQVREDLLVHHVEFRAAVAGATQPMQPVPSVGMPLPVAHPASYLTRYEVNVLTGHAADSGAPVIVERHPTYYNLIGRMEYQATFGAMVTDFRQIKPGALHRANGGYLVLHVADLLAQPFAWETLKRALLCREIRIENMGEQFSAVPAATLRPEPIPLDLKVILLGSATSYRLLFALDEDFAELFRVKAEFAPDMPWTDEHVELIAALISRHVHERQLRHFDRSAVAQMVEYAARSQEHQRKLTARMGDIVNAITEASFWAGQNGHDIVSSTDVDQAIAAREQRSSLIEARLHELIEEGTLDIETQGARVGQVNGIAILDLGDYSFGKPSRISARVALGRGAIRSVERETELSGPIHSKGFLLLNGYLTGQYAQELPLAIAATLAFEQSYDEVEGDSASSAELYALLSALAGLPVRQGIAVTGAVDQHGHVQAVGGVTRKIEGFYAVCKAQGLTGEQGVVIPMANVQHLMLVEEVVEAVRGGSFHVWAVRTIDEGIALLTDVPAGERRADGQFELGTVHRLVEDRLRHYADRLREMTGPAGIADHVQANGARPDP